MRMGVRVMRGRRLREVEGLKDRWRYDGMKQRDEKYVRYDCMAWHGMNGRLAGKGLAGRL
jgi:hypothetical protein